ncbi:MAG: GLPGLI family protein [Dysgonamonadaceae bacterium]|jgi:GLPGLI family protein|nr:GLPGLI family protein [Dysgonamonadaceae bacterium]
MKKILIFLLLLFSFQAPAQIIFNNGGTASAPQETLDTAIVKIGYSAFSVPDTLNRKKVIEDYLILEIGPKYSKYYSENVRRRDSLMRNMIERAGSNITNINFDADFFKSNNIKPGGDGNVITKKLTENKLIFTGKIANNDYEYEEPLNEMQWQIEPDTMTFLSYLCQKATLNFRGRQYEAWFTYDIPIFNGPWKFHGLPGLILKISDNKNEYRFECNEISYQISPITFEKNNYIKASREDFLKLQKKFNDNPLESLKGSMPGTNIKMIVKGSDGQPIDMEKFKRPYNPIELN